MAAENSKAMPLKAIRWREDEWNWIGEVANAVGLTRSAFVKSAVTMAAKAAQAGVPPYYVDGATASPHNTRPNQISRPIAQQGGSEVGGGGSRSRSKPEAFSGPIPEELERKGGDFRRAEPEPLAKKATAKRS